MTLLHVVIQSSTSRSNAIIPTRASVPQNIEPPHVHKPSPTDMHQHQQQNRSTGVVNVPRGNYALTKTMTGAATNVVKRNPIKTLLYVAGVVMCLLFTGTVAPPEVEQQYQDRFNQVVIGTSNALRRVQSQVLTLTLPLPICATATTTVTITTATAIMTTTATTSCIPATRET